MNKHSRNSSTTARDLIQTLWPEIFQTEESARTHPAREARRLGSTPPAAAMLAVSRHAQASFVELRRLAQARGHGNATSGSAIGRLFSSVRTFGSDLLLSREKSYRATLLGVHHTIGAIALLEDAAIAADDQQLADFCGKLLDERRSLAVAAEEELGWFAEHPDLAQGRAYGPLPTAT